MSLTPKAHLGNNTGIPSTPPRAAYPSSFSPAWSSQPSLMGNGGSRRTRQPAHDGIVATKDAEEG
eukprot:CAMPEP_0174891058 /NCGR_PEP_ID=MMETSP0167-20121228/6162_1 /TAXON_ID=38298 /ORGANISM="Rhodella maculata, Strain CCMP736" /LENGTH=64 /DNA_ID=CAMNT_0016129075 /DNA_START=231 /DNA_END=425 /DNA_ORIENTATION=-